MVVRMGKEYLDQSLKPEIRAKALLEEMSLEEKAAQLTGVFPFDEEYKNYDAIAESTRHGIGEVSTLEMRRMETLEEAAAWQRKVQEIVMENSEHHIPACQFPGWNRQGRRFRPGTGGADCGDCEPAGSSLRDYPCAGSGSGYFQGFPYGAAGRNIWGRPGPCLGTGRCLYQRNPERGDCGAQDGERGKAFSGIP